MSDAPETFAEEVAMAERKPYGMSFESFVERQIREAQERGDFDDLPGFGKPIPNSGRVENEMDWAASLARRENLDTFDMLPPALALAKEVERLPDALADETSEAAVRNTVLELNTRILEAHRRPQNGPPVRVRPVDVDQMVARWQTTRSASPPPRNFGVVELGEDGPECELRG